MGWWCLLEWRQSRQTRWLLGLAAVAGLGAVTRPLTMLVFILPVGVVVLRDTLRSGRWRPLLGAMTLGMLCLCLLYTSDAADERSSEDLGGRRIIKKKKTDNSMSSDKRHVNNSIPSSLDM